MTDLLSSSQFWLLISIGFYALGVEIQKKTGSPVCNPLLIASILVGALLIATGTSYQTYEESVENAVIPVTVYIIDDEVAAQYQEENDAIQQELLELPYGRD